MEDSKQNPPFTIVTSASTDLRLLPAELTQIDTPNDHNCLFWSAALALLTPSLGENDTDKMAFSIMYDRLFGTTDTVRLQNSRQLLVGAPSTKEGIRQALKTYDFSKEDVLNFVDNPLYALIAEKFRRRVIGKLWEIFPTKAERTDIAAEYRGNWDIYIERLRTPSSSWGWGGEAEIRAISQLVGVNVIIYGAGAGYPKHYNFSDAGQSLALVHVNAAGDKRIKAVKNHYHYGIKTLVYQAHLQNLCTSPPSISLIDEKYKKKKETKSSTPLTSDSTSTSSSSNEPKLEVSSAPKKERKIPIEEEKSSPKKTVPLNIIPFIPADTPSDIKDTKLEAEEVKFYQSSAEGGSLLAHYYLGLRYEVGYGIDRNLSHALYCFQAVIDHYPEAKSIYQRLQTSATSISTSASISTMDPAEFKKLENLKELGGGGQGKVYQAEWRGETVAVKYLLSSITYADVQRQVEHLTEAKTNQSNYLMQVKAVCSSPLGFVLEYIPGKNLTDFLKEHSDLSWLRRYRLAHDIIQGLAYLHQNGLLHRDLKSANIMVITQPYIHTKLCDFESLKKIQAHETGDTGQKVTPCYLDPEYLSIPHTSYAWYHDIYSLGRILCEIVTGEDPPMVHLHKGILYTKDNIPLTATIPGDCPIGFAQLIRDCLGPREKRPHAEALAKRLMILLQAKQQELVNQPDEKGNTPLINAISQRKIEKVATLIDCNASVHQTDSHGWTPLFFSGNNQIGVTQLLLEAKADPAVMNSKKLMPSISQTLFNFFKTKDNYFVDEITQGNLIKVKYFVEIDKLEITYSHLKAALENRQEDVAIYLFETSCVQWEIYHIGRLIAQGIEHDLINFIKYLIQERFFLHEFPLFNPPMKKGISEGWGGSETSLYLACHFGREEIVKLLLADPKIDINRKNEGFYYQDPTGMMRDYDRWDKTPAEAAKSNRNILQLLLKHAEEHGKEIEMREHLEPQSCLIL